MNLDIANPRFADQIAEFPPWFHQALGCLLRFLQLDTTRSDQLVQAFVHEAFDVVGQHILQTNPGHLEDLT